MRLVRFMLGRFAEFERVVFALVQITHNPLQARDTLLVPANLCV